MRCLRENIRSENKDGQPTDQNLVVVSYDGSWRSDRLIDTGTQLIT
jgi:hypothetical protein